MHLDHLLIKSLILELEVLQYFRVCVLSRFDLGLPNRNFEKSFSEYSAWYPVGDLPRLNIKFVGFFFNLASKWTAKKWTVQKWTVQKWAVRKCTVQKWTVKSGRSKYSKVDGPVLTKELDCLVYVQKTVEIVIFGQFVFDQKTYREQLHHWVWDWKWHLFHFYKLHSTSIVSLFESDSSKFSALRDTLRWKHFLSIFQIKYKLEELQKEFVWSYFDAAEVYNQGWSFVLVGFGVGPGQLQSGRPRVKMDSHWVKVGGQRLSSTLSLNPGPELTSKPRTELSGRPTSPSPLTEEKSWAAMRHKTDVIKWTSSNSSKSFEGSLYVVPNGVKSASFHDLFFCFYLDQNRSGVSLVAVDRVGHGVSGGPKIWEFGISEFFVDFSEKTGLLANSKSQFESEKSVRSVNRPALAVEGG